MKELRLTKGQIAVVDDEDFEELSKHSWHAVWSKLGRKFYAKRSTRVDGKSVDILLHRQILGLTDPKVKCDHKDGDGLNNQRSNLRVATNSQNQMNQKKRLNCSSKYKGISWHKKRQKWRARLNFNEKEIHLGYFEDEIEAVTVYNEAAKKYFGEFALLNEVLKE